MSRALRLAAIAVPLRSNGSVGFEVLMVRRNENLSFGGLWTFPGGTLESIDGDYPASVDEKAQDWTDETLVESARNAAVRETSEETALRCDSASMTLFSHWIPPDKGGPPKRFATWFFLAPRVSGEMFIDQTENSEARWVAPLVALAEYERRMFPVAVPTWVTLDDLATYSTVDALLADSTASGPRLHHIQNVREEDTVLLMWSGDSSYDRGEVDESPPHNRVVMDSDGRVVRRSSG
jgi:8-oxo-dGTP pyrophosphatase MutT (NUDIX family)